MLNYDVKDLKLFTLVARYGNFKVAAERMFMTVSAASLRIKKLEELFNVQLFTRKARGVELTRAGNRFLEDANLILAQTESAQRHMDSYSHIQANTICLYTNYSGMVGGLKRDLGGFLKSNPDLNIDFVLRHSRGVIEAMEEGLADIGIVSYEEEVEGLEFAPYFEDVFVFLAMQDNPKIQQFADSIYLADVKDFPIVALNREVIVQGFYEEKEKEQGIHLNIRARFPTLHSGVDTMKEIGGGMLTLKSTSIAQTPGFKMFELKDDWARQDIRICMSKDKSRIKPAAERFKTYLLAQKDLKTVE